MRRPALGLVVLAMLLSACNSGSSYPLSPPTARGGNPPPTTSGSIIVEYPTEATLLGGLALGSDGNVYFSTTTELGVFTPSNARYTLSRTIGPDTWPVIPGLKPAGAVSSTNGSVGALGTSTTNGSQAIMHDTATPGGVPSVLRLDLKTNTFDVRYGTPGDVFEDVTMTPDGNAWVTANVPGAYGFTGLIFTTKAGCVTTPIPDAIGSITLGSDGFIWFASDPPLNSSTSSKIFRVDPSNGGLVNTYQLGENSVIAGLTPGPDGALWFTDRGLNEIGRLGSGGAIQYFAVPSAAAGLGSITTGCDGALWFVEQTANKIGRITTAGYVTEYAVPTPNAGLGDIAGCLDGGIFFAETHAIGEIKTQH